MHSQNTLLGTLFFILTILWCSIVSFAFCQRFTILYLYCCIYDPICIVQMRNWVSSAKAARQCSHVSMKMKSIIVQELGFGGGKK